MKVFAVMVLMLVDAYVLAQDTWSTKASMNVARSGGAAAVINGKLYVVGGSPVGGFATKSLEVYDPTTNTWTSLPDMPTSRAVAGAVELGGRLYVFGGCVNSDCNTPTAVLEVYDPVTNAWLVRASMPSARALFAYAVIGTKIYVAGNYNASTATAIVYDNASNTWSSIASLPVPLSHAGGAAINGKFYVVGGSNGSAAQSGVYEYDPTSNAWTTKAAIPTARYVPGVGVINNQIYVVSGQGASGISNATEVYNPSSNTWSATTAIPTSRYGPAVAAIGSALYVAGSSSTNGPINTVEALTISSALANEPSSAPSTLTFSNVAATQVTLNFPAASSITNAAGYIILRRQGSTAITSSGITDGVAPASLTLPSGVSLVTTITNTSTTSYTDTSLTPATAYSYAVVPFNIIGAAATSYNYFTTTITGNTLTTLALDSTPPSITDNTPATIEVSTNLTFTATISDSESNISSAIVEWRSIAAGGNVNTVNMVGNGTTYTASINASAINELGIEYKISATSNGGTTTTGSTFKTVRVILPAADPGLVISYSDFGSQLENYRIISMPLTLTNASITSVFDELGTYDKLKWRMYRYDNGATAELSASSNLTPGLGYWLIARNNPGRELKTGPGTTVNVTTVSPFEIDLKPGWNQIGNPYYFNVSWADVQAANPGIPALRVFNGTFANATVLSAMEGGFINVSAAQKLKFPVVKNASVNGRLTQAPEEILQPLSSPDWSVALKLEQGSLVNLISGIGMRENASLDFDPYDGFNMPRFFDQYLELNHAKKSGTDYYSMDVVPTAQQQEWVFEIQATQGSPIKLSWRNFYFGNNDKALVLWDENLQLAKDMRSTTEYWFDPSTSRKFKIFFGPEAFVKRQTEVEELVLHSPWPNPVVDNNLNVNFTLPSSFTKQPVHLELTDLLGQVRQIHQTELMGGFHTISLSLNESVEGIHILSVQAGNSRKQVKVLIKKNH